MIIYLDKKMQKKINYYISQSVYTYSKLKKIYIWLFKYIYLLYTYFELKFLSL